MLAEFYLLHSSNYYLIATITPAYPQSFLKEHISLVKDEPAAFVALA